MKIYIASDHAGFGLKEVIQQHLQLMNHDVVDCGAHEMNPDDDYPDFITPCGQHVAEDTASRGIILGGSGQGEAMCANRIPGIRAGVFYGTTQVPEVRDSEDADVLDGYECVRLMREHNDANILSIGARFVTATEAVEAVRVFLDTGFSEDPRHVRRLGKY